MTYTEFIEQYCQDVYFREDWRSPCVSCHIDEIKNIKEDLIKSGCKIEFIDGDDIKPGTIVVITSKYRSYK